MISPLVELSGHPMIRHALEIVYNVLFKGMELTFPSDSFIVGALTNAMKVTYNETNVSQQNMICHGVHYGVMMNGPNKEINETSLWPFKSDPAPEEETWLLAKSSHPNITDKIPHHIIMTYFQKDGHSMDENTNPAIKLAHDSWKNMNPGYHIQYFNLVKTRKYLNEHFHPIFLRAFDCIQAFAGKSDFFRLVVLYRDGGWYSDWKQKCVKKNLLADISRNNTLYIIRDNGNEYSRSHECYSNAFIGATPQHPVIAKSIEVILKNIRGNYYGAHALDATGPCAFGKAIREAKEQYDLNLDAMDGDFREDPPYSYFFRRDEKVIMHKCEDCGASQDWELGNNYFELWWNKNYYCEDAASIFQ
mmetsp:Transcript_17875/g.35854  ORF Transcript_17875/g.35854 Transcript_17875/m.35854 type:complete len:361 (+) Transcript_17875:30-1112(+)